MATFRHRLGATELAAALLFAVVAPAAAQSTFTNHQRHRDRMNIHMWWDSSVNDHFGNGGLAGIPDLDGDGHPEVILGRPGLSSGQRGTVYVLSGRGGRTILGTITEAGTGGAFGWDVAVIGDVNRDGVDDFVVASPNASAGTNKLVGFVQLHSGKIANHEFPVLKTFRGIGPYDQFGYAVAGPGDVDGDGYPDIAVGAPGDVGKVAGAVYVFSGNPSHAKGPYRQLFRQAGIQVGERYGVALAGAGDVNGDHRKDLIVGAELWNAQNGHDHGRAEAIAWTGNPPRLAILAAGRGARSDDRYGHSVDGLGKLAGEPRVIVGAPYDDTRGTNAGMANIVVPGKAWIRAIPVYGNSSRDYFGWCVAACGDRNSDGFSDFAVSAPWDDPVAGVLNSGSVFLYEHDQTKGTTTLGKRFKGDWKKLWGCSRGGLRFGVTLAAAGDVDQDDSDDLLVGCDWSAQLYSNRACRPVRQERRVYLESMRTLYLYADRAHAFTSRGPAQITLSVDVGPTYGGHLVAYLGSGPHNARKPACIPSLGKCLRVAPSSPWFPIALSGVFHPVVGVVNAAGNGSMTMRLPSLPGWGRMKLYYTGAVFKSPGFNPTLVTNELPLWLR